MSVQLTEHFQAKEFVVSSDRPDLAEKIYLSDQDTQNIYLLCKFGLERTRGVFGPIIILSGKRSLELNASVGGEPGSQHLDATACDFTIPGKAMFEVFSYLTNEVKWPGECILYREKNFIHLALPRLYTKADQFMRA